MRILVALAMTVMAGTIAHAQQSRDGNWWREQPAQVRLSYVAGLCDGALSIGNQGTDNQTKALHQSIADLVAKTNATQISDGLDRFYDNFRNRSIAVGDGFWVVTMSIRDMPRDYIEQKITLLRRQTK